jgi:hypothetical protein
MPRQLIITIPDAAITLFEETVSDLDDTLIALSDEQGYSTTLRQDLLYRQFANALKIALSRGAATYVAPDADELEDASADL